MSNQLKDQLKKKSDQLTESQVYVNLMVYKRSGQTEGVHTDANGKVVNQHQSVKLVYGSIEWNNYLSKIGIFGYTAVEVKSARRDKAKGGVADMTRADLEFIQTEVDKAMSPSAVELTPEQIELNDLRAKVVALSKASAKTPEELKEDAENLAVLKEQAAQGSKAMEMVERLQKQIEEGSKTSK